MKSKEEIKAKIKEVEDLIVEDVLSGCFTDFQLHSHKCWIEALEYVLDEDK